MIVMYTPGITGRDSRGKFFSNVRITPEKYLTIVSMCG
jgi:hypothetical protein